MAIQIVMDRSGDSRYQFSSSSPQALADAEQRFLRLTDAGVTAATRTSSGELSIMRAFDPTAKETVFFPRLVGG
jgi:hypothetical protein